VRCVSARLGRVGWQPFVGTAHVIQGSSADVAVVSRGACETHLAAQGPCQLTMGTVVVDRSLDRNGMASRGQSGDR